MGERGTDINSGYEAETGREKGDGSSSELGRPRIRQLAGWLSAVLRERASLLF